MACGYRADEALGSRLAARPATSVHAITLAQIGRFGAHTSRVRVNHAGASGPWAPWWSRLMRPWIITASHLQRWIGRALRACNKGRVIIVTQHARGRAQQAYILAREPVDDAACAEAYACYRRGEAVRIDLSQPRWAVPRRKSRRVSRD